MRQALAFLYMRFRQIRYEIQALGFLYSLAVFAIVAAVFYFVSIIKPEGHNFLIAGAFGFIFMLLLHLNRSDFNFVRMHAERPQLVYFVEYSALILPFILILIVQSGSMWPLLYFFIPLTVCLIRISKNKAVSRGFPVNFIGRTNFEWKAGIRKNGWYMALVYLAALALTPVPFAPMLLLWFILFIITSFYELHEPVVMVDAYELTESKFLIQKISAHAIALFGLFLPVLLVAGLFNPDKWWVYLFFMAYSLLIISVSVVSKYAVWGLAGNHRSVSVTNAICMIGFFIPFLLPLPLILLVFNYRKALRKLRPILHDYN